MSCTIHIDDKPVKSKAGANLLWTALDNGFFIPNLCSIKSKVKPAASCRLCFVEIDGKPEPVTACTEIVKEGMVISISSPGAAALRRIAFELLLSNHLLDCGHCPRHRNCELQHIARAEHLKLSSRKFSRIDPGLALDSSHPLFSFNPNKCVLCGRCVWICQNQGTGILDFAFRGARTRISTFAGLPLHETACDACLNCVDVCPVGALYRNVMEIKS